MKQQVTLMSSARHDWQTPDCVLETLGPIELDPCTSADNPTRACKFYTPTEDGLAQSWVCWGLIYANTPYGRALMPWTHKVCRAADQGNTIIQLAPGRVDTAWFRMAYSRADYVLAWRGRLTFKGAAHPAPFPSALFFYNCERERAHRFLDRCFLLKGSLA